MKLLLLLLSPLALVGCGFDVDPAQSSLRDTGLSYRLECREAGSYTCTVKEQADTRLDLPWRYWWSCGGPTPEQVRDHQARYQGSGPLCITEEVLSRLSDAKVETPTPAPCTRWLNATSYGSLQLHLWWPAEGPCVVPR